MTAVYVYCFAAVAVAALLALIRVERGPSMFDRVVALDITTACVLGTVALISARDDRTDLVPVLVVLAVVGFVGSVTVARFAAADTLEEARILSREELAEVLAREEAIRDEDAPVHDPDAMVSGADDDEKAAALRPDVAEDMADDDKEGGRQDGPRVATRPGEGHEVEREERS
ncbi:monovalent cation/H+ antiporter complex subunit F [Georgenia sp. 10Sc9-8]|uniref:Monovalent cation/H+ antiporter complex subunit F n=1 Tax=Georgenia halotolerans TaxID=3028317 RepID=A0ABT5TYI5_9MICO|nr:monovalent cation/H+ antiporter complex subunit F [Georgenia halotolerans]